MAQVKNPSRTFGGATDWPPLPSPPPPAPTDLYFMCYADDHQEGMKQLTTITGTAPLLPMAAYGVWYELPSSIDLRSRQQQISPPAPPHPPTHTLPFPSTQSSNH